MDLNKIAIGHNPPRDVNVVIEIPQGGIPIKYELDQHSGALFVDRFLHTSMVYPANYGFIPHTQAQDGDPCDALVISQVPVMSGAVVRCRPIGALLMEDEAGPDEKIIAVPVEKLNPYYAEIRSCSDLPQLLREQTAHFFRHYKDLEAGKWVRILRWAGADEAAAIIDRAIARAQ